jgi:hypothetical protein
VYEQCIITLQDLLDKMVNTVQIYLKLPQYCINSGLSDKAHLDLFFVEKTGRSTAKSYKKEKQWFKQTFTGY